MRFFCLAPFCSVLLAEAEYNHVFLSPSITASDGDSEGGAPVTIIEIDTVRQPAVAKVLIEM